MRKNIAIIFLGAITMLTGCIQMDGECVPTVVAPIEIPEASRTVTLPNVMEEGGLGFGSTVQATFTVGESWSIDPETVPAWLTVEPMIGGKGVVTLNFSVKQENATWTDDTGEITIKPITGTPANIATIQLGFSPETIYSPVASELRDVMAGLGISNPQSVKIVGNLDTDDFQTLSLIPSLEEINFRGVHLQGNVVPNYAFANNQTVKTFILPASVTSMGTYSFGYCTSLETVTLPAGFTTIGNSAFEMCSSLTEITIPANVTTIGSSAFLACINLIEITLPANITTLGDYAFWSCTALTQISLPAGLTAIENNVFYSCSSLTAITIPANVTSIGTLAFGSCTNLTTVAFPAGLTTIGNYAFANNPAMVSLTLPAGLTTIGVAAFENCTGLETVAFPDNLTTIGAASFGSCTLLRSPTLPANLTTIGVGAFILCESFETITLPAGVTTIGEYAFANCFTLTTVHAKMASPVSTAEDIFQGAQSQIALTVPSGKVATYTSGGWGDFLSIVAE